MNQPSTRGPQNIFGDGTFAHVFKPLDLDVWPKSRNGGKICRFDTFKQSILQKNKWEVGRTFEDIFL
jgi:hypothetical protein